HRLSRQGCQGCQGCQGFHASDLDSLARAPLRWRSASRLPRGFVMYRRRRRAREIPFSFDSFLDVVANVCGIIIRLILVAWVGARSYHAVAGKNAIEATSLPAQPMAVHAARAEQPKISDPLEQELQRHREELEKQQQR